MLKLAALAGQGIVLQPSFNVCDELRSGRLVPLLTDYDAGALGIFIVYPHRKHQAAKVRSFIDTLVGRWGANSDTDPFWKGTGDDAG